MLILIALFILLVFWVLVFLPPKTEASSEDRLVLVQALLGEEGWRPSDGHPAILHVLKRRRYLPAHEGSSLTEMAYRYSVFLKSKKPKDATPNRRAVYALTLDTAPGWALKLVDKFLEDPKSVRDPCRGKAWHWGSWDDVQNLYVGGWTVVEHIISF
jgi:hypothetical protein